MEEGTTVEAVLSALNSFQEGELGGWELSLIKRRAEADAKEISDLKRQLSDSIKREMEVERELEECQAANHSVAVCRDHVKAITGIRCIVCELLDIDARIKEERARADANAREIARCYSEGKKWRDRADALAGAAEDLITRNNDSDGEDAHMFGEWDNLEDALTAYRNREE